MSKAGLGICAPSSVFLSEVCAYFLNIFFIIIIIKVITIIPCCAEIIDVTSFQHDNGHDDLGHLGVI